MRDIDHQLANAIADKLNDALVGQPNLECIEALCLKLSQSIGFDGQEERHFIGVKLEMLQAELQQPLTGLEIK